MIEQNINRFLFRRYAFHVVLQSFTFSLLVVFGTLFIYAKTGSIGIALGSAFFEIVGDLIIRSPLVELWWNSWFKRRQLPAIAAGLGITALASLGIYFVDPTKSYAIAAFYLLSAISSFGTSIYAIPADAIFYRTVGRSNLPGRYSSIISAAQIGGAIMAALLSLILSANNNFLVLLPILAVVAVLSIIPLWGLNLPQEEPVNWRRSMRKISVKAFWANFIGDSRLSSSGLPLILVLLFGSLKESVFVNGSVLLIAACLSYFAGALKDKGKNSIFAVCLIGLIFIWIAYSIIKAPAAFIILGALQYISSTILDVGKDARLSREIANSGHFIEGAIAIEVTKALGTLVGVLILLAAYWLTRTLPQAILIFGIIFVIPRGLYALGLLEQNNF